MEGRRISASPRPCSGRRVRRREISSKPHPSYSVFSGHEKFRNMRLVMEYDTHDPKGHSSEALHFLMKRTKVMEIVAARDIVFALALSGVCAAFSRGW